MRDRFGFTGIIILAIVFFCSLLSCFEKKTTDPESGRPEAPSSPSPADGASEQPLNLTLSWNCDDPEGDPMTYDLYFGASPIPPIRTEHHFYTEYQVSNLLPSTIYFWRVVAEDDQGNKSNAEVWSFSTVEGDNGGGDDDAWGEPELLFSDMHDPSITADGRTMYMSYHQRIYVSNKTGDTWTTPIALPHPVNDTLGIFPLANPSITGDGSTLYFPIFTFGLSYYYSRKVGGVWQEPQPVLLDTTNIILSEDMHISWDGTKLWFSCYSRSTESDDIYYSTFNGSEWSVPQPFTAVNTAEYDETGMAISRDGNSFYFTTLGRPEVPGVFSIWVTRKLYGIWQEPVPLGESINSPDFGLVSDPAISYDGSQLYFDAAAYFWPSGIYVANALR